MQVYPWHPATWVRMCSLFAATVAGAAVLLAGLALGVQQARAESVVVPRVDMAKQLADHGEAPVAMGVANNGAMIEVFAADDGITWTIVVTMPNRMSRIIAAGWNWSQKAPTITVKKVPISAALGHAGAADTKRSH